MARRKILVPSTVVLDSDRTTAQLVTKALSQQLPTARVCAFCKAGDAWKKITTDPRLELYLVVTDWVGTEPRRTSFVKKVRANYPRARIILYSASASPEDVLHLQNTEELIDRYVAKDDGIERLVSVALSSFRRYEEDPVLSSIRFYLFRCKKPEAPFTVIGNRDYSLIDIYSEILQATEIGKVAQEAWLSLLSNSVLTTEERRH